MKNNLGITMVEVVVVIIIILMIAAFAVSSGTDTLNQADITELYVEMTAVRSSINGVIVKQNMDEDFTIEKGKQYDVTFTPQPGVSYSDEVLGNQEDWYIILGKDAGDEYKNSLVKEELGLDAINYTYIVNFNTADIELYKPIKVADYTVRTYEEVRALSER